MALKPESFMRQLWLGALFLQTIGALGAPADVNEPMSEIEVRRLINDAVEKRKLAPGIVVGTIDAAGTKVLAEGRLSTGAKEEVNGDTIFEIGSATKVFTSLLLADMVRRGEVKLEDPVSKYLPKTVKVPGRNGREITLVDLATHTSALPRLPSNLTVLHLMWHADNPYASYTVDQMYEFLSGYSLPRDIGAKYEYSNLGAGLLGHALALKAGTHYEALVRQRICGPLGMTNTFITVPPSLKGRFATGHDGKGKPVSNWDIPTLAGAGALRSTVNDLLKFLAANMGKTRSDLYASMEAQFKPRHEAGPANMQIGLGWHIVRKPYGQVIWHNGGTGGYHSFMGFSPETGRGVAVLANSANDIDGLALRILEVGAPAKKPASAPAEQK